MTAAEAVKALLEQRRDQGFGPTDPDIAPELPDDVVNAVARLIVEAFAREGRGVSDPVEVA